MAGLLEGKSACVAGGAGVVGEGVVRAFLDEGAARVVAVSRSAEKLTDLRTRLTGAASERLETLDADLGESAGVAKLRDFLLAGGAPLDVVVASVGSCFESPRLLNLSIEEWRRAAAPLTAHLLVAQALLPLLKNRPDATYLFINGGAALEAVPNAGPFSISSAAQLMLKDALVAEASAESTVRLLSLVIAAPVAPLDSPEGDTRWPTPEDVGRYAAWLCSPVAERHGETVVLRTRDDVPQTR